jgi:hypothetical protein
MMFRLARWRQEIQARGYLKYVALLLLALFLWPAWKIVSKFFKRRKIKKTALPKSPLVLSKAGADSDFYRIEEYLNAMGLKRYPWETLTVWLNRIEQNAGSTVSLNIPRKSLALHYRYRFDPKGISASEKSRMASMISAWLAENHLKPEVSKIDAQT